MGHEPYERLMGLFFGEGPAMQRTLATLCESNQKQHADTVTLTVQHMLAAPVHVQLTAVGWQPFKGKELVYPYLQMDLAQRQALLQLMDEGSEHWQSYESAMVYRHPSCPARMLPPLHVLEALCALVLACEAYKDRRLRMAACNILLQRIQSGVPIERGVQSALNQRLFPPNST